MKHWSQVVLSFSLLLGAFLLVHFRSRGEVVPIHKSLEDFPKRVSDWNGQEDTILDEETLNVLKLKNYVMRRYVDSAGNSLGLYIGYWDTQRKGAQIHSPKHCLPGGGWEPLEAKQVTIALDQAPGRLEVNRYLLQKDQYQQVVVYWFQSRGQAVASEVEAKLQLVKNAIMHNRTDGALIRIISPVSGSVEETFERQAAYVRAIYPLLSEFLPN